MPITLNVYTGYFITALRPRTVTHVDDRHCKKHGAIESDFCPKCGKPAIVDKISLEVTKSIGSVIYGADDCTWMKDISDEDIEWLRDNVAFIEPDTINQPDDFDYIAIGDGGTHHTVECGTGAVVELDPNKTIVPPSKEDIDRVARIMGYEQYTVLFGTLAGISW